MSSAVGSILGTNDKPKQATVDMTGFNQNSALTDEAKQAQALAAQAQQRQAQQVVAANAGQAQQVAPVAVSQTGANVQGNVMGRLDQASQGLGPSAVQSTLQKATDQNIGQQGSLALSMGGRNPGLAMQTAMGNAANVQQQSANTAATLKAQEMQQATGQLGQVAGQVQGQNINEAQLAQQGGQFNAGQGNNMSQFNATLAQQAAMGNQGANLQQGAQNNAFTTAMMGQQFQGNQTANQNMQAGQQLQSSNYNANQQLVQQQQQAEAAAQFGVIKAAGGAAAMSDKRMKEDIHDAGDGIDAFLKELSAKSYDYKDEAVDMGAPAGEHVGVMAQSLEKSDIGKGFVKEDENGVKNVDYGQGFSAMMASIAHLNKKVDDLSKKKAA